MIPSQNHQWSVFIVTTTTSTFIYYKNTPNSGTSAPNPSVVGLRRTSGRKAENTNSEYPSDHNQSSRPRSHPLGSVQGPQISPRIATLWYTFSVGGEFTGIVRRRTFLPVTRGESSLLLWVGLEPMLALGTGDTSGAVLVQ